MGLFPKENRQQYEWIRSEYKGTGSHTHIHTHIYINMHNHILYNKTIVLVTFLHIQETV